MRSFEFAPVVMILLLTMIFMAAVGLLVLVPIALLEWGWNLFAEASRLVPAIGQWQAFLLYLAFALVLYILGLVKIEVRIKKSDS